MCWSDFVTEVGIVVRQLVIPGTSSEHSLPAIGRSAWIIVAAGLLIIIFLVPIAHPFKHIACHIHHAVWTCPWRVSLHWRSDHVAIIIIIPCRTYTKTGISNNCQRTIKKRITPAKAPAIITTGSFFPLSFRWQTGANPFTISHRIITGNMHHRM